MKLHFFALLWTMEVVCSGVRKQYILSPRAGPSMGEAPNILGASVSCHLIGEFRVFVVRESAGYVPSNVESSVESQLGDLSALYAVSVDGGLFASGDSEDFSWGLDRINQVSLPLDGNAAMSAIGSGDGVDVYVMDSGVNVEHADFEGRALWGLNRVDSDNSDCSGHGTHVAGTVISRRFGVAKKARVIAVKVLACTGESRWSSLIRGIQWATEDVARTGRKGVLQISLSSVKYDTGNDAIDAAYGAGLISTVAAGNKAADACDFSPASASKVIAVASSGRTDQLSSYSNFGPCVDIVAPGEDISSTEKDGTISRKSGTSMASPHVAGVVAQIWSTNTSRSPDEVRRILLEMAAKNKIVDPKGSPNLLLQALSHSTASSRLSSSPGLDVPSCTPTSEKEGKMYCDATLDFYYECRNGVPTKMAVAEGARCSQLSDGKIQAATTSRTPTTSLFPSLSPAASLDNGSKLSQTFVNIILLFLLCT
jgi:hypothetical protein